MALAATPYLEKNNEIKIQKTEINIATSLLIAYIYIMNICLK
jgi:hypothetical protein